MKNYYCIIEQYGEMRNDWRLFQDGNLAVRVYTNKKTAELYLKLFKNYCPSKNLWLAKVDVTIFHKDGFKVCKT